MQHGRNIRLAIVCVKFGVYHCGNLFAAIAVMVEMESVALLISERGSKEALVYFGNIGVEVTIR